INGKPMLLHVVERCRLAKQVDQVIVATTTNQNDDKVVTFCKENQIKCFRGDEDDVLERYYSCALFYKADIIIRICADCPFIEPSIIDKLVQEHLKRKVDYSSTARLKHTFPRGTEVEVFGMEQLKIAKNKAQTKEEKEHVTYYFYTHPEQFSIFILEAEEKFKRPHLRLTVDTIEDYNFVKGVYKKMNRQDYAPLVDVITTLDRYPELLEVNKNIEQKKVLFKGEERDF
ncbi:MAG: glycosyltransferase family protein, partial [Nanoarchaeota archaeon]|nr:glycosyltransferase family protein [Nanoarchaeota archaeon]